MMFSGFRSRCTTPCLCMVSSASQMASVSSTARSMGSLPLLVQNRAQQPALDPLDHHVAAAAVFAVDRSSPCRDGRSPGRSPPRGGSARAEPGRLPSPDAEPSRPPAAVAQIRRAEERGHAAARNLRLQAVVVQRLSGFQVWSLQSASQVRVFHANRKKDATIGGLGSGRSTICYGGFGLVPPEPPQR